jgi:ubiquinone/menaquinone biosynthesis C-methylase UbiE
MEVREQGMGRGNVYPAKHARQLINPLRRLIQSPGRLVGTLGLSRDATVLEIGCGPGYFSPAIAAAVPDGRLAMFDYQHEMLTMARSRLRERGLVNFDSARGDGMALPYRDASFDAVFLILVLGEIPDEVACLREVARVLKRGGQAAISESRTDADFHRLAAVRALAERAGLRFVRRHGPPFNYTAVFSTSTG